jgi:hypothetical protein
MAAKILVGFAAALLATGMGVYVAFLGPTASGGSTGVDQALTHSPCCSSFAVPPCCSELPACCADESTECPTDVLAACAGTGVYGTVKSKGNATCCEK